MRRATDRRRRSCARLILLLMAVAATLPAAPAASTATGSRALRVTVSLPPQAWLVERIAGDRAEVAHLVGPGDSPATFQPTDAQITLLARSALYFRIGVPFENGPWFRAIERAGRPRIVDLRTGVPLRELERHSHHEPLAQRRRASRREQERGPDGGRDPHTWLSPSRLRIQARTVAGALEQIDSEHGAEYRANLATLTAELEVLEAELERTLAPLEGTPFFVLHPSWGYFADDYGLRQVAVEIEGKVPAEHELTKLFRAGRELGIRVVFVQPQFAGAAAEAVASALGGRVETLDPLAADVAANLRRVAAQLLASRPAERTPE